MPPPASVPRRPIGMSIDPAMAPATSRPRRTGGAASRAAPALDDEARGGAEESRSRTTHAEATDAARATQDPLKLYVRQIGDGRLLTPAEERELARRKDEGDEAAKRKPDRVEPAPRHVDHAQLHQGRRAAPRPDPGGQPRPDPRGREVRLQAGLQAFDVRDLVDPPGGHPRARRPGPHDPAARPRRRAGAPRLARRGAS